jgi:DNA-binding NtrC family response regulator
MRSTAFRSCEILIVDDEAALLAAMGRTLSREFPHCGFVLYDDPMAALVEIDTRPFAAVISDFKMPKLSGAELLAHVQIVQPRALRILYSGNPPSTELSAHLVLEKPDDFGRLRAAIGELIAESATSYIHPLVGPAALRR